MGATLKDVARAAGVSIKTVSNVVNGYEHVSAHTREVVQHAIDELDYRPNVAARNLRRGRTGLIAVAVPTLANPYFAELAQVLVSAAERAGLTVLVDCTGGDAERERRVANGFDTQLVDGVVLIPHAIGAEDLRRRRSTTPLVLLSERSLRSADTIAIDSRAAATAATEHLIARGRRRIAYLGLTPRTGGPMHAARRLEGYRAGLESAGLTVDDRRIALLDGAAADGRSTDGVARAARSVTTGRTRADAVVCFNDLIALSVMRTLLAQGVRVPEDVAVIGIDDIAAAALATPSLSSVAPDTTALADAVVTRLQARLAGDESAGRRSVVGFSVVARESTGGGND